jgi:hypothetical protein
MTRSQTAKLLAKNSLLYLALALAGLASLPLLAGLALAARILMLPLAVAALIALCASPAARGWLRCRQGSKSSW